MKYSSVTKIVFSSVLLLILASGCSTVKVPMKVTHPAEINMTEYKQIAVGDIDGNMGRAFSDGIKNSLVESGRFKVVDRSRMKQVMAELNLSQSDLIDSKNRVKLGRLLSASAMIAGHTEGKYKEKITTSKGKCGSKKEGYYTCTRYHRKGVYSTSGSIDVIDVATGEIIRSKVLNASYKDTNSATDKRPDPIDKDSLAAKALSRNINTFLKSIKPWTETVHVPFKTDGSIPDLEKGINQAKIGDLDKSIRTFADAAKAAEGNAKIKPKSIATAYFDLGLAYHFSWEFDKAIAAFKKAYEMNASDSYIKWVKYTEKQKKERKKLEAQGAAGA